VHAAAAASSNLLDRTPTPATTGRVAFIWKQVPHPGRRGGSTEIACPSV